MTPNQMEELATMIVDKLVSKQKELDQEFIKELEASNLPIEVHEKITNEDRILMEIDGLNISLQQFLKSEDYNNAIKCTTRIDELKFMLTRQ